jgi:hypothetical protein
MEKDDININIDLEDRADNTELPNNDDPLKIKPLEIYSTLITIAMFFLTFLPGLTLIIIAVNDPISNVSIVLCTSIYPAIQFLIIFGLVKCRYSILQNYSSSADILKQHIKIFLVFTTIYLSMFTLLSLLPVFRNDKNYNDYDDNYYINMSAELWVTLISGGLVGLFGGYMSVTINQLIKQLTANSESTPLLYSKN